MKVVSFCLSFTPFLLPAMPMVVTHGDHDSIKIEIDLRIDGIAKRFQIDTGANTTHIHQDQTNSHYPSEGKSVKNGASGTKMNCDLIRPQEIHMGPLSFQNQQIQRCELPVEEFNNLGIDLLDRKILYFNFQKKELGISEISKESGVAYEPIERLDKGHLKMKIRIGENEIMAIFDTGAQLTAVDTKFVKNHPDLFRSIRKEIVGNDVGGNQLALDIYHVHKIQVGSMEFLNLKVVAFDFPEGLRQYLGDDTSFILGTNAITQANWVVDLIQNRWALIPRNGEQP